MAVCANCGQENPEGFRFCGSCGAELAAPAPAREVRKTVTILFCDVTGSTAMGERLDPESTRRVMTLYFDAMRAAIERHGGTVEKFIGDAVMAVFGIPVVHEDDALRAVRAAADMRAALTQLNDELERDWGVRIESRIGVNTGEVVAGEGDSLAIGRRGQRGRPARAGRRPGRDAARRATHRLVREAVTPSPSSRSTRRASRAGSQPSASSGSSRARSSSRAVSTPRWSGARTSSPSFSAPSTTRSPTASPTSSRCSAPRASASRVWSESCTTVSMRPCCRAAACPYGDRHHVLAAHRDRATASEIDFDANRDEIALQTRRILERLSHEKPLVVVFDDLQWAEPTFLDLVDHVTDLARDAPMLLLCVARPDLLDDRPGWGGGKLNATTMLLDALTEDESAQLVDNVLSSSLDEHVKQRIASAAEGNPLFVEEMLAMVAENGNGDLAIPPTIQALLAARLDRLVPDERTAIECAAIQGQEFRPDALARLVPEALSGRLIGIQQSLVRKDLIRPAGEDTYRFKHLLLRDAAYESLPKEQRADLHERFAEWLEVAVPEVEEIRGYHLEQAYRYRAELGPVDERALELARRASRLLATAGRRASHRADIPATIHLLERAVSLLPDGDREAVALYPDLGTALDREWRPASTGTALSGRRALG